MNWKLVPTRLTQNMADAAKCVDARLSVWKYDDAYQAMLANAPEPPETSTQTVAQLQARVAELEDADSEGVDYSLKAGAVVTKDGWSLTPLIVVDVNWALRAVALRLGEDGGVVVWPAKGLRRV